MKWNENGSDLKLAVWTRKGNTSRWMPSGWDNRLTVNQKMKQHSLIVIGPIVSFVSRAAAPLNRVLFFLFLFFLLLLRLLRRLLRPHLSASSALPSAAARPRPSSSDTFPLWFNKLTRLTRWRVQPLTPPPPSLPPPPPPLLHVTIYDSRFHYPMRSDSLQSVQLEILRVGGPADAPASWRTPLSTAKC